MLLLQQGKTNFSPTMGLTKYCLMSSKDNLSHLKLKGLRMILFLWCNCESGWCVYVSVCALRWTSNLSRLSFLPLPTFVGGRYQHTPMTLFRYKASRVMDE